MLNEFEKIYIKIILFIIIIYSRPIFPQIFNNQTYGLGCIVITKRLRDECGAKRAMGFFPKALCK